MTPLSAPLGVASASTMTPAGTGLHSLPAEVLERVLIFSDPRDVSRYAQTCRLARRLVYEPKDHFLWRELYLGRPFDDLRKAAAVPRARLDIYAPPLSADTGSEQGENSSSGTGVSQAWMSELQRRTEAEAIAASSESSSTQDFLRAFEAFLAAVDTALPVAAEDLKGDQKNVASRSENLRWLDRVLRRTKVLYTAVQPFSTSEAAESSSSSGARAPFPSPVAPRRELRQTKARTQPPPSAEDMLAEQVYQMRCRLRAYVALSHESNFDADSRLRMATLRKESRCYIYDMRRYQGETLWGPYRVVYTPESDAAGGDDLDADTEVEEIAEESADTEGEWTSDSDADTASAWGRASPDSAQEPAGRRTVVVNWEHIEHILNVVGLKLREVAHTCLGYYKKPLFTVDALRAYSAVGAFERPPHDWAGVTGKWRRFVCFMDYRDLYMFNYGHLSSGPHHPSFFEDPFDEALRPVEIHLSLISAAEYFADARQLPRAPPTTRTPKRNSRRSLADSDEKDDPDFPTLYFEGHSRGPHASTATIRGTVSTLADGAVRWQFVTTYDGRMQWSAEGIQIGHVCSAAGIAGIWTGAHHQRDDPAGPFWMTKADDDLPEGVLNTLH